MKADESRDFSPRALPDKGLLPLDPLIFNKNWVRGFLSLGGMRGRPRFVQKHE